MHVTEDLYPMIRIANSKRKALIIAIERQGNFKGSASSNYASQRIVFAGSIYGEYVANGNTPLDIYQFAKALPNFSQLSFKDLNNLTYEHCLETYSHPAEGTM
jgi:hypothetical protein